MYRPKSRSDSASRRSPLEVHEVDDRQYVLASDRDFGLYIFQPDLDDDERDDD